MTSDARVKFHSGVISLDQSQFLLRIATSEIASFCIDNRLRQMAFSVFAKVAKAGFRVILKDFELKKALSVVVCFVIV